MVDGSLRYGAGILAKENRKRRTDGLSCIACLGDIFDDIRMSREVSIPVCSFLRNAWRSWMGWIVSSS